MTSILGTIVLVGCHASEPDTTNRDDGATRLTEPPGAASDQNACWSPDGSFVVFTRFMNGYNRGPGHLFRVDIASGETANGSPRL